MSTSVKLDISGLVLMKDQLGRIEQSRKTFCEACVRELAARLLRKVIQRTPVGTKPKGLDKNVAQYWEGYSGGTLRRGWTTKSESEAESGKRVDISTFIDNVNIEHVGDLYSLTIINSVHYAAAVEFGHRQEPGRFVPALGKRLKSNFVKGHYMLTISEKELENEAPAILEKKLEAFIRGL